MTPTEELRKRLDERGVEYETADTSTYKFTRWCKNGIDAGFGDFENGEQPHLLVIGLTPVQAIDATVGWKWEPSKEWKAWYESLKHDNPTTIREAVENILFDAIDFGGNMGPNGNVWSGVDEGDVLTKKCIDGWVRSIESVAATAGVDSNTGEVIRKLLDKLNTELCNAGCVIECETREERQRLIDAVKDKYAQAIAAMVGKDIERYDGSGRRGTVAILQGGRKPEEMLFFREDGDVTHYLPDGEGTLTAEQVRECARGVYFKGYIDGATHRAHSIEDTDWQTIADKLNATLGAGTCRLVDNESGPDMHCTVCGREVDDEYRYFMERWGYSRGPHCGRRIEEDE